MIQVSNLQRVAMNRYELDVLHGFSLIGPSGPIRDVRPVDRIVLGVLAACGGANRRDYIADIVWGADREAGHIRHSLAQSLYRINKELPALITVGDDRTIEISSAGVSDIQSLLNRSTRAATVQRINRPIAFLADLKGPCADYDRWRDGRTASLRVLAYESIRSIVRRAASEHDWSTVLELGTRAPMHAPLCGEVATALVNASLAMSSDRSALNLLKERIQIDWPHAVEAIGQLQTVWNALPRRLAVPRRGERPRSSVQVGRTDALRDLTHTLTSADTGPQFIALTGERGIGKTRLVQEMVSKLPESVRILYTKCYPTRSRLPYAAISSLIEDNLSRDDWHGLDDTNYSTLVRLLPRRRRRVAGRRVSTAKVLRRRDRMLAGLAGILGVLAASRRLVLVIDDAQWLDLASAGLLSDLLRVQREVPLSLIIVRRTSEEVTGAASLLENELERIRSLRIDLQPLVQAESIALARRLVPDGDNASIERLANSGCGNPLIMVELASASAETSTNQALPVPSAIVDHRLRGLRFTEQRVLSTIVLAGRPVQLKTLSCVARQDEIVTQVALAELETRGLIVAIADGSGYVPSNDLVAARCQSFIPMSLQRYLHRMLADAAELEGLPATIVADHLMRADARKRGARAALLAAKECFAIGAYEAALYFIEAATRSLSGTDKFKRMIRLYSEKLIEIGRLERAASLLEGRENQLGLSDLSLYVRVLRQLNTGERPIGQLLSEVKSLYAREPQWLTSVALLTDFIGTSAEIAAYAHDREFLIALMSRLVAMARKERSVIRAVEQAALASRLACLSNGLFDPVELSDLCDTVSSGRRDRPTRLRVLLAQASANWYSGSLKDAYSVYSRALEMCEDSGLEYFRWRVSVERSALLIDLGDLHRAVRDLAPTVSGCSDRERAYALANLGAAAFERTDTELLDRSAQGLRNVNEELCIPWIDVVALSYSGFSSLLRSHLADAYQCACLIAETLERHVGLALNEPSYAIVFAARAFESAQGPECGLNALRQFVAQEPALSAAARIRVRLEEARLSSFGSTTAAEHTAVEALDAAERIGANRLSQSAQWLVRQIRVGRSTSWRRFAEVHASASS